MAQHISTRSVHNVRIIDIAGDVTVFGAQQIKQEYQRATAEGATKILLVFAQDCILDSAAIGSLVGIVAECTKQTQRIRITGLSSHLQTIFTMVGLAIYARIEPSEEAALANFAGP
jgi:anti-anti-sigma factor